MEKEFSDAQLRNACRVASQYLAALRFNPSAVPMSNERDAIRLLIDAAGGVTVARTEQTQESTTVRRMGDFGVEVVEVQDERFCASCGCQGGVHHGWCKS